MFPSPPFVPEAEAIEPFARNWCCCGKAEVGARLLPASPQHQGLFGAAGMVPGASGTMNPLGLTHTGACARSSGGI